jgi:hypothetical protein
MEIRVYMYICMYVRACVYCTDTYIYIYVHICLHTNTHLHIRTYTGKHLQSTVASSHTSSTHFFAQTTTTQPPRSSSSSRHQHAPNRQPKSVPSSINDPFPAKRRRLPRRRVAGSVPTFFIPGKIPGARFSGDVVFPDCSREVYDVVWYTWWAVRAVDCARGSRGRAFGGEEMYISVCSHAWRAFGGEEMYACELCHSRECAGWGWVPVCAVCALHG